MKELTVSFVITLQSLPILPISSVIIAVSLLLLIILIGFVLLSISVSKRNELEVELSTKNDQIQYMERHDPLTGLSNRDRIMEQLQDTLLEESNGLTALYSIDVVNLRLINDAYGHEIGDRVLQHMAIILKEEFAQAQEYIGIYHTTFLVVDSGLPVIEDVRDRAAYLTKRLSHTTVIDHMEISIKINMGVALAPLHSLEAKLLMKKANIAQVEAAKKGINSYHIFQDTLYKDSLKRLTLEKQLRRAVTKSEFEIHYQPRIDLESRSVCGCEALIRWNHPDGRTLYPNSFIPLAESIGFINEITKWVTRRVATQVMAWEAMGFPIKVSFNISGKEFDDEFITMLSRIIKEERVNPALLEVEITETAALKDIEHSKFLVDTLNDLGVTVALDDFGTGYSSMTYIKKLKASKLKIDKTFIEDIDDYEQKVVVDSMIQLGQRLNYRINVEGVETEAQLEILKHLKVDEVQGWLFSKAVPASEFITFVKDNNRLKTNA